MVICKKRTERAAMRAQKGDDSDTDESSSDEEEDFREQCAFCQRKFNPGRIAKHEQICAMNKSRKPRKSFKSTRDQRLENTDFEAYKDNQRVVNLPPSRWRARHETFIGTVRQGRLVTQFKEAGIPLSELPPNGVNLESFLLDMQGGGTGSGATSIAAESTCPEGFVPCPHCKRTFSRERAEKHIPKCKTTVNRPKRLIRKSKVVLESRQASQYRDAIIEALKKVVYPGKHYSPLTDNKEASMFRIDDRVVLEDGRMGTVRYNERVEGLNSGFWLGVEVDEGSKGRHDGYVDGRMIFLCKAGQGVFVRPSKVKKHVPRIVVPEKKKVAKKTKPSTVNEDGKKMNSAEKLRDKIKKASSTGEESPESEEPSSTPEPLSERPPKPTPRDENEPAKNSQVPRGSGVAAVKAKAKQGTANPQSKAAKTQPKKKREKLEGDALKAYNKGISKDVAFLEKLHGKMSKGEAGRFSGSPRDRGSPRSTGSPKPTRVISCGGGQRLGSSKSTAPTGAKGRSAAAAQRAAFFEKKFGK